ncbi:hypothetical protein [Streptomyces sp. NPDC005125]
MIVVLATLLGTLAGAVATIGAAMATGWAQREGAQIAARSDHRKERREPRLLAYKAFIQSATELKDRVGVDGYEDTAPSEEESLQKAVNERWIDLSLLGPVSVTTAGSSVRDLSLRVIQQMARTRRYGRAFTRGHHEDEDSVDAAGEEYSREVDATYALALDLARAVDAFALVASAALDEDGTESRRSMRRSLTT